MRIVGLLLFCTFVLFPSFDHAYASECPTFESRSEGLPTSIEWRTRPVLGDVNSDGRLDIAGNPRKARHPYVWLAQENGTWETATAGLLMPGTTCGVGVDLGDVNSDGHLDLIVADHCNGLFLYLGDGNGAWRLAPKSPMRGDRRPHEAVRFGDINGDGHLDIVAIATYRGGFTVRLGDGKGNWRKTETGLPEHGYGTDVELVDVNRDGHLDVVAAYSVDLGRLYSQDERQLYAVWVSTGPAQYVDASDTLPWKGKIWDIAVGDVNADGFVDLVASFDIQSDVRPLELFLGDGGKTWTPAAAGLPPVDSQELYEGVALADVNGDGHVDLTAMKHIDAGISLWLGDGKGAWSACPSTGLPTKRPENRGWGVTVHDVNDDGRADVTAAFGRNGEGSMEVWVQR